MKTDGTQDWVARVGRHPLLRRRPLVALIGAVVVVGLAIAARLALRSELPGIPYLTLFPAVMICTFAGGWLIGLFTIAASALGAAYFLLPPEYSFSVARPGDLLGLAGFVVVSLLLILPTHIATRTAEVNVALADQRQVLLMELQHRIKNHLQLLGAMLATHAKAATNERIRERLEEAGQRLQVMAATYDNLYEPGALIDMRDHLRKVCAFVEEGVATPHSTIEVEAVATKWPVEQVVPLSLIANELLTNAVKHLPSGMTMSVAVRLERVDGRHGGRMRFSVLTRNVSLPADFQLDGGGLGLRIASMLAQQLGGTLTAPELPRALFVVEFPERRALAA
jgi:two-component sensor histidine kinase